MSLFQDKYIIFVYWTLSVVQYVPGEFL